MNTCSTCRHWKALCEGDVTDGSDEPKMWSRGVQPITDGSDDPRLWEHGVPQMVCDGPHLKKFVQPDANGVSVMDGSYYRAIMHTGKDFGCLHHSSLSTESQP